MDDVGRGKGADTAPDRRDQLPPQVLSVVDVLGSCVMGVQTGGVCVCVCVCVCVFRTLGYKNTF